MADELESGAVEGQPAETPEIDSPAPSIRDSLRSAYDEQRQDDAGATGERARDQHGRFAPRTGADPQTAATDDPAAAARARETTAQPAVDPNAPPAGAPQAPAHWTVPDKEAFAKADPVVQARWLEREAQFSRVYNEVVTRAKSAEPVMRQFESHAAAFKQAGVTPEQYVGGWITVEQRLMKRDPQVFAEAVKAYRFNAADVIAALGGQAGQQPAEGEYVDPRVAALEKQIQELQTGITPRMQAIETHLSTQQEQAQQAAERGIQGQITEFAAAKNADGSPAHPYYAEVEETMLEFAQGQVAAGKPLTVKDLDRLYDSAVYAHPTVRAKVLADQQRADDAKRTAEAKAKAAAARTAGSSITGTPSAGQSPSAQGQNMTIGQQLRAAARDARG